MSPAATARFKVPDGITALEVRSTDSSRTDRHRVNIHDGTGYIDAMTPGEYVVERFAGKTKRSSHTITILDGDNDFTLEP